MTRKTAVIYGRVSSPGQAEEELPIEGQLEACRREADQLGAEVLEEFVDAGISGRTTDRPAFIRAISYCRDNKVDYFIAWSTSRFARNRVDAPLMKMKLKGYGTSMAFVSNRFDNSTKEGWMIEGMLELMDDFQSRTIAEDTKRSMQKNARDGFFNGGIVPFGYRSVPAGKRRKLEIDEDEAALVREIFRLYIECHGFKSIALKLNAAGTRRRGREWNKSLIERILKNPVYTGHIVYSKKATHENRVRPEEEWIKTKAYTPIIDEETFEMASATMKGRSPASTAGGSPKSTWRFTGLVRCGRCDSAMVIETATGRSKTYSYYNCARSIKGGHCTSRRIPAPEMDAWLGDYIVRQVLSVENLRQIAGDVHQMALDWAKAREKQRRTLVAELHDNSERKRKIYDLMETTDKDALNLADVGPRLRELQRRTRELESSLNELENAQPPHVDVVDDDLMQFQDFFREMVVDTGDPIKAREFLALFVDKITLLDEEARIDYRKDRLVTARSSEVIHSDFKWGG